MTGNKVAKVAQTTKAGRFIKSIGEKIIPVAIVAETGLTCYRIYNIEQMYENGKINKFERNIKHGESIGSYVGTMGGMGILMLVAAPTGPVGLAVVGGTIVGIYVLDRTGKVVGRYVAEKYNEYLKEREKFYTEAFESFYNNIEVCELSDKDLRACGFAEVEIKVLNNR